MADLKADDALSGRPFDPSRAGAFTSPVGGDVDSRPSAGAVGPATTAAVSATIKTINARLANARNIVPLSDFIELPSDL
ncbi:MAG: hypothetical protein WBZ29_03965 [Methanocella sp.]